MRVLKAIVVIFFVLVAAVCSAGQKSMDADQYWKAFRQAVIDNEKDKVIQMTQFPFEVRGPDDSDPVQPYDAKGFSSIYERLVMQSVFLPSDGKLLSKSMRQLIDEKRELKPEDYSTPDSIHIFQFEFKRIKNEWRFTRAYLEE